MRVISALTRRRVMLNSTCIFFWMNLSLMYGESWTNLMWIPYHHFDFILSVCFSLPHIAAHYSSNICFPLTPSDGHMAPGIKISYSAFIAVGYICSTDCGSLKYVVDHYLNTQPSVGSALWRENGIFRGWYSKKSTGVCLKGKGILLGKKTH